MYTSSSRLESSQGPGGAYQRVKQGADDVVSWTGECIRERPASSALTTFAVGCGLGFLASMLLWPTSRRQESGWSNWMSRGQLARAVEGMVPDAVSRYLSRHR
jgi:hypothetical protein